MFYFGNKIRVFHEKYLGALGGKRKGKKKSKWKTARRDLNKRLNVLLYIEGNCLQCLSLGLLLLVQRSLQPFFSLFLQSYKQ